MYKLLLVDDEDEVREGIALAVDWESCGFELCAQASGAIDALEKAAVFEPDIVFTDVRMPYMNGLEMIEHMRELYPTMQYIVLSGYDDFDYVQKALKYQVLDYMLKPISAHGIMKVLKEIKLRLDSSRSQSRNIELLRSTAAQNAQQLKRGFLVELLANLNGTDQSLRSAANEYGAHLAFPIRLAVFAIDATKENEAVLGEQYNGEKLLLNTSVQGMIQEILQKHVAGECIRFKEQFVLFLQGSQTQAQMICNETLHSVRHFLELSGSIAISYDIPNYTGIYEAYQNTVLTLDRRLVLGSGHIFFCDAAATGLPGAQEIDASLDAIADEITALCRKADEAKVDAYYDELIRTIAAAGIDYDRRKVLLASVLGTLLFAARQMKVDVMQAFEDIHIENVLLPMNAGECVEPLRQMTKNLGKMGQMQLRDEGAQVVERMIAYLNENIRQKDLSMEKLAAEFNVSQTQGMIWFKRETGTSLIQYLIALRVSTAADLLLDTNKKIYEIAEETGFTDANYFSYCFKQRHGISPMEYRHQRGG